MKMLTAPLLVAILGAPSYAIAEDLATDQAATEAEQPETQPKLTMDPMWILDPGAKKTAETTGHAAESLAPELESLLEEAEAAER